MYRDGFRTVTTYLQQEETKSHILQMKAKFIALTCTAEAKISKMFRDPRERL